MTEAKYNVSDADTIVGKDYNKMAVTFHIGYNWTAEDSTVEYLRYFLTPVGECAGRVTLHKEVEEEIAEAYDKAAEIFRKMQAQQEVNRKQAELARAEKELDRAKYGCSVSSSFEEVLLSLTR